MRRKNFLSTQMIHIKFKLTIKKRREDQEPPHEPSSKTKKRQVNVGIYIYMYQYQSTKLNPVIIS